MSEFGRLKLESIQEKEKHTFGNIPIAVSQFMWRLSPLSPLQPSIVIICELLKELILTGDLGTYG